VRTALLVITGLLLSGLAAPTWSAEAKAAYRERTSMLLLAEHCNALGKMEKTALVSGQIQARGALLRSGEDARTLDVLQADLTKRAELVSCERDDVRAIIARMNDAAQVWLHLYTMRFPARWQSWEARRDDAREKARWRVRAPLSGTKGTLMDFGLVAEGEQVFLDLVVFSGRAPSSIILRMRDPKRMAAPMNADMLRLMGRKGDGPANLMPPKSVMQSFFATDKMPAPLSLTGEDREGGKAVLFRFGQKALAAFSTLDPRDVVEFELIFPARRGLEQRREHLYAEAGDFAAARLFAQTFPEEPISTNTN
jgi:hypothetical protein